MYVCMKGGFVVLRPSMEDYRNLVNILMTTEFVKWHGWNNSNIGWYYLLFISTTQKLEVNLDFKLPVQVLGGHDLSGGVTLLLQ